MAVLLVIQNYSHLAVKSTYAKNSYEVYVDDQQ